MQKFRFFWERLPRFKFYTGITKKLMVNHKKKKDFFRKITLVKIYRLASWLAGFEANFVRE